MEWRRSAVERSITVLPGPVFFSFAVRFFFFFSFYVAYCICIDTALCYLGNIYDASYYVTPRIINLGYLEDDISVVQDFVAPEWTIVYLSHRLFGGAGDDLFMFAGMLQIVDFCRMSTTMKFRVR